MLVRIPSVEVSLDREGMLNLDQVRVCASRSVIVVSSFRQVNWSQLQAVTHSVFLLKVCPHMQVIVTHVHTRTPEHRNNNTTAGKAKQSQAKPGKAKRNLSNTEHKRTIAGYGYPYNEQ